MSLTSPDLVYTARLSSIKTHVEAALGDCDKLIDCVKSGMTKKDVLLAFIQQVRPFIALECQLELFVQDQALVIEALPQPAESEEDSIVHKIELIKYHLCQTMAYIDAIATFIARAEKPLTKELNDMLDSLVTTAFFDS